MDAITSETPASFSALEAAIAQVHGTLSPRLRQIAEFALANPNDMALETVAVVAERAGVQPSSLIRFAKVLGFDGYTDMQRVFRTRLVDGMPSYKERVRTAGSARGLETPADVLDHFALAGIQALEHLRQEIRPEELDAAVALLRGAEHVYLMGQRRSFPAAVYFGYALGQLGRRVVLLDGIGGMIREQAQSMTPRDVLLAVSFKPYSDETVEVCRLAAGRGVPVLSLTDGSLSPLAPLSTVRLVVDDAQVDGFRSLSATMCLAVGLIVALGKALETPARAPAKAPSRRKPRA
ncbi:MurR/RpiR family transcriptional regulator [Arenibaculum pallidiluteum]|uniref:MurR/RpiR family transcriptional regulator n=1 Tax=Arenibaculum pallidiluteum TaxID=2812559 RepID=UPI001F18C222|nr:MurR/RpiR family transcriptional regulator [Arenibaculum pallidiluteum]